MAHCFIWKKDRRYFMQPTVNLFIGTGGKHDEKAAKEYIYIPYIKIQTRF